MLPRVQKIGIYKTTLVLVPESVRLLSNQKSLATVDFTTATDTTKPQNMTHPRATEIYFNLNTGAKIPSLGLGTVNPPEKMPQTKDAVKHAVKNGYRLIDTAWMYGSEPYIGEALQELFEEGVVKREDLFITTKVWPCHYNTVEQSLQESLKQLKLDYVDLLLQHWPLCFVKQYDEHGELKSHPVDPKSGDIVLDEKGDYLTTWKQLEKVYKDGSGRVRNIGVSNYPVEYLERLLKESEVVPVLNQVELHPLLPQEELSEYCNSHGILMESFSPLGSSGTPHLEHPLVKELSKKYGCEPGSVLLNYHVRKGNVVVPRSLNHGRIIKNADFVALSKDDLDKLSGLGREKPVRVMDEYFATSIPGFHGTHHP